MIVELVVVIGLGIALSLVLGGNNVASCIGTSIGAGVVRYSHALVLAGAGVFLGVILEGGKLSNAISGGTLPELAYPVLSAILLATFLVMAVVTTFGVPLSLSQVAVGAAWGAGLARGLAVNFAVSWRILVSWLISPPLAFAISALLYLAILRLGRRARNILSLNYAYGRLTLAGGFYTAYALGANAVGLIVGMFRPLAIDLTLLSILFALVTIAGMMLLSHATTRSVAENIVGLSASAALSAQLSGALTVHIFTQVGMPVSISQSIVGAVAGAAATRKIVIRNERLIREILAGWTLAPLSGAAIAFAIALVL